MFLPAKKKQRRNRSKYIITFALLLTVSTDLLGQVFIDNMHYRHRIENSEMYMNDTLSMHSSVLPLITLQNPIFYDPAAGQLTYAKNRHVPTYYTGKPPRPFAM